MLGGNVFRVKGSSDTVIAAVALVLFILPAFAVMYWPSYTLNSISLVISILVDETPLWKSKTSNGTCTSSPLPNR